MSGAHWGCWVRNCHCVPKRLWEGQGSSLPRVGGRAWTFLFKYLGLQIHPDELEFSTPVLQNNTHLIAEKMATEKSTVVERYVISWEHSKHSNLFTYGLCSYDRTYMYNIISCFVCLSISCICYTIKSSLEHPLSRTFFFCYKITNDHYRKFGIYKKYKKRSKSIQNFTT